MLVLKPDMEKEKSRIQHENAAILGVAGGITLAMLMATFAVWREIRREHALVNLRNRFIANVSHELKTPLALIRMYAETLYLKRITDPERQHDYHRIILREAERLSQMINTVLDFARLRQGMKIYHFTDYNLHQTLLRILDDYKLRLEQYDIQLDMLIPAAVPSVAHDPHGVTQIMLNLMDNAIKHGGGGHIRIGLAVEGDWVILSVTDFGPGIRWPRRHCQRVFSDSQGNAMIPSPAILIIDDDSDMSAGLRDNLEVEGYQVVIANTLQQGRDAILQHRFNIVLLDLMLPDGSGINFCRQLRQQGFTPPSIMLTARSEEMDKVLGFEVGADDYVVKPFGLRELLARVQAHLRRGVVSRDTLLTEIWGHQGEAATRTVDNFIVRLRKKIEPEPTNPHYLITVHGSGYKLIEQ